MLSANNPSAAAPATLLSAPGLCPSVSVRVSPCVRALRQSAITSPSAPGPCPSVFVRVSPCVRAPRQKGA